jgi:predicted DCC family thiol-disulfide oxidoreductase YuxK
MPETSAYPQIILFDGVCNLCNSVVQWVIERDAEKRFVFASLQSDTARRRLERVLSSEEIHALPDSVVLIDSDGVHVRSAAAMRIARGLGAPYALLGLGVALPRPVRDAIYNLVARKRYRWFGRRDTCMTPSPDVAERFLDAEEPRPVTDETESPAGRDR